MKSKSANPISKLRFFTKTSRLIGPFVIAFLLLSSYFAKGAENKLTIENISFEGLNHTKPNIISVELEVTKGDAILSVQIDSILNAQCVKLFNLQLFHWVRYNTTIQNNRISVQFVFQERWYLWPVPILSLADRNINSWLQNKSLKRIDYGLHLVHNNFMGLNQKVKSNLQGGFNQKYEIFYTIPYVDQKRILGLDFGISTFQSHSLYTNIINGKPINLEVSSAPAVKISYLKVGVFRRKSVQEITRVNLLYQQIQYHDSVFIANPNYFHINPKGAAEPNKFMNLEFTHTLNKRQTFSYPTDGYFAEFQYKGRTDLLFNAANYHEWNINLAKYFPFNKGKMYLASGIYGNVKWLSSNNLLDTRQFGYKKNIRGFEYYVIHGHSAVSFKNNVMYQLFDEKLIKLKFLGSEKFKNIPLSAYIGGHTDGGFAWRNNNSTLSDPQHIYSNQFLAGAGLGIHLVTYYDRVLVLEYTFNNFGENGFYINTSFPI